MAEAITVGEILFEFRGRFTDRTEYGFPLRDLLAGKSPPPGGARVDVSAEGALQGPRLTGTFKAVDYLHFRGDSLAEVHVHMAIATEDGESIAVELLGIFRPTQEPRMFETRTGITFLTASPKYEWLNRAHGVGVTGIDPSGRELHGRVYAV